MVVPMSRQFFSAWLLILIVAGTLLVLSPRLEQPSLAEDLASRGFEILEAVQAAITQLAEQVTPTVVTISPLRPQASSRAFPRSRSQTVPGSGSGVLVSPDGYIVTNHHVVGEDAIEAEVRLSDKRRFIARIVGRDQDTDIALLKIESNEDLPWAPFGDSTRLKVGQWVLAVGNPMGLDRTVTLGVVSGIGRDTVNISKYENFIQTDAAINPGNSGGPLFNLHGEIIGINTAIIHMAQGIGFSIPADMVVHVVEQLRTRGHVVRGWLGVGIQSLTPELANKFGVSPGRGVLVNEVFKNDPADAAGILPGDIIVSIEGTSVETPKQLSRLIARFGPGETVHIDVIRNGRRHTLPVVMGEKEERAVTASLPFKTTEVALGIDVQTLTPGLAERFGLNERSGVLVSKVDRGSLAYTEGLQVGDLIKEVNRKEVRSVSEFSEAIQRVKPGDTILLRIVRGSRAFFVVLKTQGAG
ncbi:MAG: Do family serine endopeptidase [Nitrospirae bacterium]|nr:MAG: Do family serine endopeptidase [Nitrospirota bacterium]